MSDCFAFQVIVKKLVEINATRGRKSTNRKAHVKYLQELYRITVDNNLGPGILAKILLSVISALFELNARISDAMEFGAWLRYEAILVGEHQSFSSGLFKP